MKLRNFDVRFTGIYLHNHIANFKINYKGKLYSGCAKRNFVYEAENEKIKDITHTRLGAEMLIAAHNALKSTEEYTQWLAKFEESE